MNDRQIYMNAPEGASPEELARYLDAACGRNNGLRLQVESLFEAEKRAGSAFMEVSPLDGQRRGSELSSLPRSTLLDLGGGERVEGDKMEVGSSLPTTIVLAESPGAIIGNYKLRKKIGEGGFGVVFEAEQLWPLKRRVALKIIRIGMDTGPVVARFKLERQALALMDHPSIAKVYDAGVAESGRPFFVMELVRGVPINDYCDGRNLTTPERLELFIEVCMAVQHAHLKGVIHRDLKPSNILVTEVNDVPTPKIIDFGIAKATQATLTDGTLVTAASEVVGTPEYMSPEQAGSAGFDVDTRCDVYSLGATLYQLITGVPPIKLRGEKIGVEEMFRRVREEVPALPSIRIATAMGEAAAQKQGEKIGPDASALLRRISRDLDWIILKALEKQRQRRYQRPEDLAADLRAYLTNRPVSARAPSVLYRTGKLVQRHRSAFQLAAVCFVIVALSMVIFARARSQDQAENTASLYLQSGSEHARELLPEIQLDRPAIRRLMEEAPGARGKLAIAKFETLAWEEIEPSLWTASTDELPLFLDVAVAKPSVSVDAWEILADVTARRATRLNAAAALARFAPQDQRWNGLATQVASLLVFEKSGSIAEWIDLLQPVQSWLREPLADLVADAEPAQFGTLATALARMGTAAIATLGQETTSPLPESSEEVRDAAAKRRARQALMQLRLGEPTSVLRLLRRKFPDDPRLQTYIIHGLAEYDFDPNLVSAMAKAAERDDVKRALLEALGGFDERALGLGQQRALLQFLVEEFRTNQDAGIHSTCEWLLRKWDLDFGSELASGLSGAAWSVNSVGFTMVEPKPEPMRRFAIASTHVSIAQYRQFDRELQGLKMNRMFPLKEIAPTEDCPIVYIEPRAAMRYCNWLSERDGLPQTQWCYESDEGGGERLHAAADFLTRKGYRMPTEAELELAIRGGSTSVFPWGADLLLAHHYYAFNREGRAGILPMQACGSLRPNAYGLFDGLGLALQICHAGDGTEAGYVWRGTAMQQMSNLLDIKQRAEKNLIHDTGVVSSFRVAKTLPR